MDLHRNFDSFQSSFMFSDFLAESLWHSRRLAGDGSRHMTGLPPYQVGIIEACNDDDDNLNRRQTDKHTILIIWWRSIFLKAHHYDSHNTETPFTIIYMILSFIIHRYRSAVPVNQSANQRTNQSIVILCDEKNKNGNRNGNAASAGKGNQQDGAMTMNVKQSLSQLQE